MTAQHRHTGDEYVPPIHPVDEPPTWRARCSCGWTGPQRYSEAIAGTDLTARDHRRHTEDTP